VGERASRVFGLPAARVNDFRFTRARPENFIDKGISVVQCATAV
jgi:hypothetical protein